MNGFFCKEQFCCSCPASGSVLKRNYCLAQKGARVEDSRRFFFFFRVAILLQSIFFGNLMHATKLVLNTPTRLSTVVSVDLLHMRYKSKF